MYFFPNLLLPWGCYKGSVTAQVRDPFQVSRSDTERDPLDNRAGFFLIACSDSIRENAGARGLRSLRAEKNGEVTE
jgi:hypothetical protein